METNDLEISFESETSWSGNGTTENDSFLSTSSYTQSNEIVPFPPLPLLIARSICKKNKTVQCKPIYKTLCVQAVTTTKSKYVQVSETRHVRLYGIQTTKVEEDKLPRKKCSRGKCLKNRLSLDADFETFAQKLHKNEQTYKFVKCISMLATGKLAFTNMSWKCFLDMGTLLSCTSTTNMEYDRKWLEFCQVLYHMFGAGVINALRGRGHFSQVACEKTKKGKYDPVHGEFNFPIPSIPTLKKLHIGFPTEIPVGFVEQSLVLAESKACEGGQFVLSFDGKLIAPGCKGDCTGDSNLWGKEGPPNLDQAVKTLNTTLKAAKSIGIDINKTTSSQHFTNCKELLNLSSWCIRKLRSKITSSFYS